MNDQYQWCTRLFLSVDIVGSTAFKSALWGNTTERSGKSRRWIDPFKSFFETFPVELEAAYSPLYKKFNFPEINAAKRWKFLGDEILFEATLQQPSDALTHLMAFRNALEVKSTKIFGQEDTSLSLKGSAWTAGFPVQNAVFRPHTEESEIFDYLGRSIDLGFRLCQYADNRCIPICIELATILIESMRKYDEKATEKQDGTKLLDFGYHGSVLLKGVNNSDPYPILWIDRRQGKRTLEEDLLGRDFICNRDSIETFANEFFRDSPCFARPFIVDKHDNTTFGEIDEELKRTRDAIINEDPDRSYQQSVDKQDQVNTASQQAKRELPATTPPST